MLEVQVEVQLTMLFFIMSIMPLGLVIGLAAGAA
jgi:hypothetical protein